MGREVYQSERLLAINGNQAVCNVATCEAMKEQPNPNLLGYDDVGMFNSIPYWFKEDTSKEYDDYDKAYYDYSGGYINHGLAGYGENMPCSLEVDNYIPFSLNKVKKELSGKAGLIEYNGILGEYSITYNGTAKQVRSQAASKIKEGGDSCYFVVATDTIELLWGCPKVISNKPKKGLVPIYVYTVGGEYHV